MKTLNEVADKVWKIGAVGPGYTVAIVGGTHGNERTGIEVVMHLVAAFAQGALALLRGTLFLAIGNPRAVAKNQRGSEDGADLNRCFTDTVLGGAGASYEELRARELAEVLQEATIGIDLHATNKPSVPFVMSQAEPNELGHKIVGRLAASILLTDPKWVFAGAPVTLDEFFARRGGLGVCYETGLAEDTSRIDEVEREILSVLRLLGMIEGEMSIKPVDQTVYALTEAMLLDERGFAFADGFGGYNFQPVEAGQIIGHHGDEPRQTHDDGVIVFPKIQSLWRVGAPVGYLARKL